VHPFSVSHDAADPVGFHITDGRWSLGYCTDTGLVSRVMRHRLQGCHALVLESNHDPGMLRAGPYPPYLQQRVLSKTGHLANRDAAAFLADLLHDGLRHVVLSHISETNNSPLMVNAAVAEMFEAGGFSGNGAGVRLPGISLAAQDRPGEYFLLAEEYC
jgi:phosphoribosyl 1,2-cyclic phosphodiesterase